jgi:hypothetical protein
LETNLYKSNEWSHHHCKSFSSVKCWSTPLKGVWNTYPTTVVP